ncbi:MAG: FprA family A-type flavoprotein [Candidatus Bathyarchaeia archaeon]
MLERNVIRVCANVYWVGAKDWNRRIFDALIPLPRGTSYNAYLIIGSEGKALIDTVNPGFENELEGKICSLINPKEIDYIIMNHAEPDHAGAIPHIMGISPKSRLVTTARGSKMAQIYYHVPQDRIKVVADNEIINLGDKTLRFIDAPMLHWPETMFTYLEEDGVLFPCDFFGAHIAGEIYSDEVKDLIVHVQRYWGEIMMPYRTMAQRALDKISGLNIKIIAPSHGPIHRKPEIILSAYRRWAAGETRHKATIVYVSMWGSTGAMVNQMAETLMLEGVEVALHNLVVADIGELAKDLVDSRAVIVGAPTVLGGAHPLAIYAAYIFKALRPPTKFAVILSSYGWGGSAVRQLQEIIKDLKIEVAGALEINGPPTEENMRQIIELGKSLAKRIKEES